MTPPARRSMLSLTGAAVLAIGASFMLAAGPARSASNPGAACWVIGDSLAVGVGQYRPECATLAKAGVSSQAYLTTMLPAGGIAGDAIVISLGVNDGDAPDTLANLRDLRARVRARTVSWLLPGLNGRVRRIILTIASAHGDHTVDTLPQVGRDHLHPSGAGYQRLAAETRGDGGGGTAESCHPRALELVVIGPQPVPPEIAGATFCDRRPPDRIGQISNPEQAV